MENKIDLSPEALQKRREIAGNVWTPTMAINPDAVIAMIDEIERLRSENVALLSRLEACEDESGLTAAYMAGQMDKIDTIGKLKRENARLEKEADWLAENANRLEELLSRVYSTKVSSKMNWRVAARKAVEEQ